MMELARPAGTPAALRAAVEAGAHSVYCGFNDETNARNFPGLNLARRTGRSRFRLMGEARRCSLRSTPSRAVEPLGNGRVRGPPTQMR